MDINITNIPIKNDGKLDTRKNNNQATNMLIVLNNHSLFLNFAGVC
jgi:hypothetical protein